MPLRSSPIRGRYVGSIALGNHLAMIIGRTLIEEAARGPHDPGPIGRTKPYIHAHEWLARSLRAKGRLIIPDGTVIPSEWVPSGVCPTRWQMGYERWKRHMRVGANVSSRD